MTWAALILAGCFEVAGVMGIALVNKRPSFFSYLLLIGGFILSFNLLSYAMREISMGTAYAVWTGIGTAGSALLGMLIFREPKDARRLFFMALILVSVIGLKMVEG